LPEDIPHLGVKVSLDLAWSSAILRVLKDHYPKPTSLQDIYLEVWKYRESSDHDSEYTNWNEPRYQHVVRGTLHSLKQRGFVENIRWGVYALRLKEV